MTPEIERKTVTRPNPFAVFTVFYVFLFLLLSEGAIVGDGLHYFIFFPALLSDGNLNLSDEFSQTPRGSPFAIDPIWESTGYAGNPFPFGASLLEFPFFLFAWLYDHSFGFAAETGLHDFFSAPYVLALICSTGFYVWCGFFCVYRILRRLTPRADFLFVFLGLLGATSLFNYAFYDAAYSHAYGFFAVALFYCLWYGPFQKVGFLNGMLLGAAAGMVFLIRWQDVLFLLPAFLEWRCFNIRNRVSGTRHPVRSRGRFEIGGWVGFSLWVVSQLLYWKIVYGRYLLIPLTSKVFSDTGTHFFDLLFSRQNGLFRWHPLLAVALAGLILISLRKRRTAWLWAGLISQLLFIGFLVDWTGSYSFGQRRWVSALPIFAIGLGAVSAIRSISWKWIFRILVVVATCWNILVLQGWREGFFQNSILRPHKITGTLRHEPENLFKNFFSHSFLIESLQQGSFASGAVLLLFPLVVFGLFVLGRQKGVGRKNVSVAFGAVGFSLPVLLSLWFVMSHMGTTTVSAPLILPQMSYPKQPAPLVDQRVSHRETFEGGKPVALDSDNGLHLRFQNPQCVHGVSLITQLETESQETSANEPVLRVRVRGRSETRSMELIAGVHADFPSPRHGKVKAQGGELEPSYGWRLPGGGVSHRYASSFRFAPLLARELLLEVPVRGWRISVLGLALAPINPREHQSLSPGDSPPMKVSVPTPQHIDHAANVSWDADLSIPYSQSSRSSLHPVRLGDLLHWRDTPFRLPGETFENVLTTSGAGRLRFSVPWEPIHCSGLRMLLGGDGFSKSQKGQIACRVRFFFEKVGFHEVPIRVERDVWGQEPALHDHPIPSVLRFSANKGLLSETVVRTFAFPKGRGALVGFELLREDNVDGAVVIYAATALP